MRNTIYKCGVLIFCSLCLAQVSFSQEADTITDSGQNRIFAGIGAGLEYGLLGIQGAYRFNDHLTGVFGAGISPDGPLWNIGIEKQFSRARIWRFTPYATLLFGTNAYMDLSYGDILETYMLRGFSTGAGINWRFFRVRHNYLKFGINYRIISGGSGRRVQAFNEKYETDISDLVFGKVLPVIGFHISI